LIGELFRSDSRKKEKTELVLLITPKIVDSADQADSVIAALKAGYEYLDFTEKRAAPVRR